jgi:retron-type reverse transcriptase
MAMVLEAIYEQDFLPCSYGLRPGRSAHQALRELFGVTTRQGQYWVIEVDVRKYFDSIPHSELRTILDQRVTDGVIRRMIVLDGSGFRSTPTRRASSTFAPRAQVARMRVARRRRSTFSASPTLG